SRFSQAHPGYTRGVPRWPPGVAARWWKVSGHADEIGRLTAMDTVHDSMRRQGLVRPREGRVIAGVCTGLGQRFGIDPWPARILLVLLLLAIPGTQILVYPTLWILMPSEPAPATAPPASPLPPAPMA